eukprot:Gb_02369 [translate_table: standard]
MIEPMGFRKSQKLMEIVRKHSLLVSFVFLCLLRAQVGETKTAQIPEAPLDSAYRDCPLNVSYLASHPWIVQKCQQKTHCCEAMKDLMRILLFSWMHHTDLFLLSDSHRAVACMDAIQHHMESEGVADDVFKSCEMSYLDFVNRPQHCHGIHNISDFERAVDTSEINRDCNGSVNLTRKFLCHTCVRAMARALHRLMSQRGGEIRQCEMFVLMYVGGGLNAYEELGPDAASCILSAQNLPELAPVVASAKARGKQNRGQAVGMALGISIPAVGIVVLMSFYVCSRRSKLIYGIGARSKRLRSIRKQAQLLRESVDLTTGLLFFRFADIKEATANFSASNVIGEGGFGTVHRGTLPDGSQIAVKSFKDSTNKGDEVFKHEVQVISSVKHRNLLPLKGYCIWSGNSEHHQHFTVTDFMANGSLADYLFKGNKPCLTWPQRYKIAVGIARGLAYLHEDAKPAIIHRDVKAANVLLDGDLNPLVADFGLARFKEEDRDKTHYTTKAVGTHGYVAPEYALYGHLTDKSDVFSFGILLLELISGRKALDSGDPENMIVSDWAYELTRNGRFEEVIEKRIRDDPEATESMHKVILLALQCAHARVACRPSIQQALVILESIDHPLPEIISLSNMEFGSGSDSKHRGGLDWLLSPDMRGRISYGSGSIAAISTDSYQTGR